MAFKKVARLQKNGRQREKQMPKKSERREKPRQKNSKRFRNNAKDERPKKKRTAKTAEIKITAEKIGRKGKYLKMR